MQAVYSGNVLDGCGHIATHFESMEKATKIISRAIDISGLLLNRMSVPLKLMSTQLKDLIFVIESTRLFPVSFPLFVLNENGMSFFQVKTKVQVLEKMSLAFHLTLKTASGLDRVKLIKLGSLATYSFGHLTVFRWLAESSILLFNFFGAIDASLAVKRTNQKLNFYEKKILQNQNLINDNTTEEKALQELKNIKHVLELEKTRSMLKVAATVSKFFVIIIAVTLAAANQVLLLGNLTILSLGIISDSFGLARIFHSEYIT